MNTNVFHLCKNITTRPIFKKYRNKIKFRDPLIIQPSAEHFVAVFNYGVIVTWGMDKSTREDWIKKLSPYFQELLNEQNTEATEIQISQKKSTVEKDSIHLKDITPESVATVSTILARSTALEYYEEQAQQGLEQFTPVMDAFEERGKSNMKERELLKMLGRAMKVQHAVVTHIPLLDKPDVTWENHDLDRFYEELSVEYELEDRYESLSEKLKLLFQNIEFIQNYLDTRHGHFLEWIIILLILFEVVLFLIESYIG